MNNEFNLFSKNPTAFVPLAERMRPHRLEQVFGQEHLLGENAALRQLIETDQLSSIIFWGPSGTGKTTLAKVIADYSQANFIAVSAVMSGIKELREAILAAEKVKILQQKKTILFIDEIHRFNRSQQDALLPHVENGTIILIGATTENPSFEVNSALLSRAAVYVLNSLTVEQIKHILIRALIDKTQGLAKPLDFVEDKTLQCIAEMANGDARQSLNFLEKVVTYLEVSADISNAPHPQILNESKLAEILGKKSIRYDHDQEGHYNVISAFIKSMRDSDPDAAIYYLAVMLEGGEDPLFIVRRMVIFASEDIGNADPRALEVAINTQQAVHFVGMPEARINLAQATIYLAVAPKSNASYLAIEAALETVKKHGNLAIPKHLLNAPTSLMKNLGYSQNYKYAHAYEDAITDLNNLPIELQGTVFYQPKEIGIEKKIKEHLSTIKQRKKELSTKPFKQT